MIRDINKHAAVVLEGVPTPGLGSDGGPAERPPTSGVLPSCMLSVKSIQVPVAPKDSFVLLTMPCAALSNSTHVFIESQTMCSKD